MLQFLELYNGFLAVTLRAHAFPRKNRLSGTSSKLKNLGLGMWFSGRALVSMCKAHLPHTHKKIKELYDSRASLSGKKAQNRRKYLQIT
jgi:hypothetical protein